MASSTAVALSHALFVFGFYAAAVVAGNFYSYIVPEYGDWHVQVQDNGQLMTLSMDNSTGSGIRSINPYLFGRFDLQIKLVPNNSAGTVTTFYFTSKGFSQTDQDEIDLEFLGNVSGQPYTLHTNIFYNGKADKEQQFHLWFDPTQDFHTYSIVWNPQTIIIYVDGIPLREYINYGQGIPFPHEKKMYIYSTLWSAEWATQGGRVKTDWNEAPFTASFRNITICSDGTTDSCTGDWASKSSLDETEKGQLNWVKNNFLIYNYCTDIQRFPGGLPLECSLG